VIKGLQHSSHYVGRKLFVDWIEASDLENAMQTQNKKKYDQAWTTLREANGILVPGGFGLRGVEGKIIACKHARENKIPYFGICYGLQIAVVEYAMSLLGWKEAHSEEWEFDSQSENKAASTEPLPEYSTTIDIDKRWHSKTPHRVVVFMPEIDKTTMGGNMRLGARKTIFSDASCLSSKLYQKVNHHDHHGFIMERHRHRYEVNPEVVKALSAAGLSFVGQDETGVRQEIIELKDHPFFVAAQYHPEFKSRPLSPMSPLFAGFMLAAAGYLPDFLKGAWKRPLTEDEVVNNFL